MKIAAFVVFAGFIILAAVRVRRRELRRAIARGRLEAMREDFEYSWDHRDF